MVFKAFIPNNLFSLDVKQYPKSSYIRLEMLDPVYNTQILPHTYEFLERHLPSILHSKCYNKHHYPFTKEVRATQIAHLFEHMILEYLSASKKRMGVEKHIHNGLTKWDWVVDKRGVFHIDIDSQEKDSQLLYTAIEKSTILLSALIRTN